MSSVEEIQTLGRQLLSDPVVHANHAVRLLAAIDGANDALARSSIQALKLFVLTVFENEDLSAKRLKASDGTPADAEATEDAEGLFRQWLRRQYRLLQEKLLRLLQAPAPAATQVTAFAALMEFVRCEAPGAFAASLFGRTLRALVTSRHAHPEVYAMFFSKHLPHIDVRYHTLAGVARLAARNAVRGSGTSGLSTEARDAEEEEEEEDAGGEAYVQAAGEKTVPQSGDAAPAPALPLGGGDLARNLYDVLAHVAPALASEAAELSSWCGAAEAGAVAAAGDAAASAKARRKRKQQQQQQQQHAGGGSGGGGGVDPVAWANPRSHKRVFSSAWLEFLRMELPPDVLRKVLVRLPQGVLPWLSEPVLLSDFLTHALDAPAPLTAMLALNGLFVLVTQHGLEYPGFYNRLYALITPEAFLAKHRAQFFKLADIFLASGLVPAYTAAAFAKRFARRALTAPPAGAMLAVAFVHNLIRRHPSCVVLLHRPSPAAGGGDAGAASAAPAVAPSTSQAADDTGADGARANAHSGVDTRAAAVANGTSEHAPASDSKPARRGKQRQPRTAAAGGSGADGAASGAQPRTAAAAAAQQLPPPAQQLPPPAGSDPYDVDASDPADSRAVESSLWELSALRHHYCPQVAAFVTVLDKDLTDRVHTSEVDLEPLLAASYLSLFSQEAERRLKHVALAFYAHPPTALLPCAGGGSDPLGRSEDGMGAEGGGSSAFAGWT